MKYQPDEEFRKHLNQQGVRGKKFKLDPKAHADMLARFRAWHPEETEAQLEQRVAHKLIWDSRRKHNAKWYLKWLAIGAALLLLILAGSSRAEAQVDCVKWQNSDGTSAGTYCAPFVIKAGTNVTLSKSANVMTITSSGVAPGVAGSNKQVQFNDAAALAGNAGLTFDKATGTLTATHITGLDNKPYIDAVRDCGAVGDGVTDDGPVIQTCINAHQGYTIYFPKTQALGTADYYSAQTLFPKGDGMTILGQTSGFRNSNASMGGVVIKFAANTSGIWFEGIQCSGCGAENISLFAPDGHDQMITPTKMNIPSGTNLPIFNRTLTSVQRATNVITGTVAAIGLEGLTQQVGSVVKISGVTGDSTLNGTCVIATLSAGGGTTTNPRTFTCAQNGSDSGPYLTDGTLGLATTGTGSADGIRNCANFTRITNVSVRGFSRHGFNGDSGSGNGCTNVLSDDAVIYNSNFIGNQGNGYFCRKVDCNAGYLSGNTFYYNAIWGAEDQSDLGNTMIGNQASYDGLSNASSTTPTTKVISAISRTLSGSDSTVSVTLETADANIKVGSAVVIAGVTDSSFNSTSGSAFFVSVRTDSTHYQYIQPGAPADASSSGGTSRMAKFTEAELAAGIDNGSYKITTQSALAGNSVFVGNYNEGSQNCKFGSTVFMFGGVNLPFGCVNASIVDFSGLWFAYGAGGHPSGGVTNFQNTANNKDAVMNIRWNAGKTAHFNVIHEIQDFNASTRWTWDYQTNPAGSQGVALWRGGVGSNPVRIQISGNDGFGVMRINSENASAVDFNVTGANSGTGGIRVGSGGASPAVVATVDSAGKGTFNGGLSVATGVSQNTGIKHGRVTTGSIGAGLSAAVTLTWGGSAFADTSYTVNCSVLEATTTTSTIRVHHIESVTTTTAVVRLVNDDGSNAKTGVLHCAAMHD